MNARRQAGISRWFAGTLSRDAVPAFVSIVGTALVVYLLSWSGWFASSLGWGRRWADEHPAAGIDSLLPNPLRSLIHYHEEMWRVSTSLSTSHPYATNPIGWFFQERPTLFFLRQTTEGAPGCPAGGGGPCMEMVTSLGTLSIWYAGVIAVVAAARDPSGLGHDAARRVRTGGGSARGRRRRLRTLRRRVPGDEAPVLPASQDRAGRRPR